MTYLLSIRHFLFTLAILLASAIAINAQSTITASDVPRTMSYQGLLTSTDGTPFADGSYDLTVTIYGDEHGTHRIWQNTYSTQVNGGIFNLYLGGDAKPLPSSSALNTALWIGTSVDGAPEMRPLTPLSASPYALNVPDKAITAEKVDMDYISELRIDGQKVSGKGMVLNLMSTPEVPLNYDETTQSVTIGRASSTSGMGDEEKGSGILATQDQVWSANGDGWDVSAGATYTPAAGDWLGTSNAVDLEFKVQGGRVMLYQTTGAGNIPNIIGGQGNTIAAANSVASIIAEGTSNSITNSDYNVIGGGSSNSTSASDFSSVVGGEENSISDGPHSFIGGGETNFIDLTSPSAGYDHSVIAGGWGNEITSGIGFIGGGYNNRVDGIGGAIVGGIYNVISTVSGDNFIGGGLQNEILGATGISTIGGGAHHIIEDSWYSIIGAGAVNHIEAGDLNTISGGSNNRIMDNTRSTIGGGFHNIIEDSDYGVITGGESNIILSANHATIGGGQNNTMQASYGTIPGGDQLLTQASYAQVAVGFYNAPRGSMPTRPNAAMIAASNDPLFMVGNGSISGGARSNAFEVSYNGHSVVYGKLGNTAGTAVVEGATYADNVVYGWGEISAAGGMTSGFGLAPMGFHAVNSGVYVITVNVIDPNSSATITLTDMAVTATLNENVCAFINVVRNGSNTFTVNIRDASCNPIDLPFSFHVTGRR